MGLKLSGLAASVLLLSACGFLESDDFEFAETKDQIEGVRMVAHKQFINSEQTLVADVSLKCNPSKKSLDLEIVSLAPASTKSEGKLPGVPLLKADNGSLIGKVKLGAMDAVELTDLPGLNETEFNNQIVWSLAGARAASDLIVLIQEKNALSDALDKQLRAAPELAQLDSLNKKLDEKRARLTKYQSALESNAPTSDADKQAVADKVAQYRTELGIESDEKYIQDVQSKNSAQLAILNEGKQKLNVLQPKIEDALKRMFASDPRLAKQEKERQDQAKANPMWGGLFAMTGDVQILASIELAARTMSAQRAELAKTMMNVKADSELLAKLGPQIAFNYKANAGEMTFSVDLNSKNIQKVVAACR